MATTTTNFGWTVPSDTDLVKDGAAAIRTALGGVDTSFVDLKGGTTGQVLSKATGTDLDFSWTSPASNQNWSLLNAGGTALTAAATITVSGISGKDAIMVIFVGASSVNSTATIGVRLNTDTGANYNAYGTYVASGGTFVAGGISQAFSQTNGTYIPVGIMSASAGSAGSGYCLIQGANTAGVKPFQALAGFSRDGNDSQQNNIIGGIYSGSSTISSISMFSASGNFDAGTVYVYATA